MSWSSSVRKSALAVAAAALLCASDAATHAQEWAKANLAKSPRHGEYVTIVEPNGRKLQAWVVYPQARQKTPVVVMIHEIFGLTDWAREMADEVAGAGYIVVEPDLLSGFGPPLPPGAVRPHSFQAGSAAMGTSCDPMDCAPGQKPPLGEGREVHSHGQPMAQMGVPYIPAWPGGTAAFPDVDAVVRAVSSLPDAQILGDLDAAADYGKKLPAASGKLFVVGFCWGGGKSFLFATHRSDLSAAFVFYGPPPPAEAMKNIIAPVYGFYAGNDARISTTVPQTKKEMKAAGKVYEPVVYDGAGHGFMRAGEAPDASAENSHARREGFNRLVRLLNGTR